MELDRIFAKLAPNEIPNVPKEEIRGLTQEEIFDDIDDYDFYNNNEETNDDIAEGEIFVVSKDEYISDLKCEISVLKEKIHSLEEQVHILQSSNQFMEKRRKQNAPAYREDINVEKIVQLYKSNESIRKISIQLECSPNTVKNRLIKLGYIKK